MVWAEFGLRQHKPASHKVEHQASVTIRSKTNARTPAFKFDMHPGSEVPPVIGCLVRCGAQT